MERDQNEQCNRTNMLACTLGKLYATALFITFLHFCLLKIVALFAI